MTVCSKWLLFTRNDVARYSLVNLWHGIGLALRLLQWHDFCLSPKIAYFRLVAMINLGSHLQRMAVLSIIKVDCSGRQKEVNWKTWVTRCNAANVPYVPQITVSTVDEISKEMLLSQLCAGSRRIRPGPSYIFGYMASSSYSKFCALRDDVCFSSMQGIFFSRNETVKRYISKGLLAREQKLHFLFLSHRLWYKIGGVFFFFRPNHSDEKYFSIISLGKNSCCFNSLASSPRE